MPSGNLTAMISVRDRMVLELAAKPYRFEGRRTADALELVGYRPTQFWARVRWLLDQPEVEAERPAFVRRQRRLHEARMRLRRAG